MTERMIQTAVARADLILCAFLRFAAADLCAAILLVAVWAAVIIVRARLPDPDVIPYDVTSEGPEGYTPAYYEWEDENNDMG